MLQKLLRLVVMSSLLAGIFATGVVTYAAGADPVELVDACVKPNGLMRYVATAGPCKKNETLVAVKPGPTYICVKPSGSLRRVASPSACVPPPPDRIVITLPPVSGSVLFCATDGSGVLRRVTTHASCTSTEFPVYSGAVPPPPDTAPGVTSTAPANGAVDVAVGSDITIDFSESVAFAGPSFTIACPSGSPVAFAASGSPGSSATLDPSGDLPFATECVVTVLAAGVTDSDADDPPDAMASNVVFSFTTAAAPPADTAPSVSQTNPVNGASDVAVGSDITVTFSESVNFSAASFELECPDTVPFAGGFAVSGSGTTAATINPTGNLPASTTCEVTVVAANVSDTDGDDPPDAMAANVVFSFTTAAAPPADTAPSVTSTVPTNGAVDVALDADITVNFSESVAASASSVTVECPSGGPFLAVTITGSPGTQIQVDPTPALPASTECVVTVLAANISDSDADDPPDAMTSNFVFSFTTAAAPPPDTAPSVTGTTPANGAVDVATSSNISIDFSEAASWTAASFEVECPDGSPIAFGVTSLSGTTATIDPTSELPTSTECVVTVLASGISDTDADDPPDTMTSNVVVTFTTAASVDTPPTANDDTATVAEDDVATAIDVLADDSNADGGPMNIASASDPANGTVVLTGGSAGAHTGLTYAPDPNYCNDPPGTTPDTFTYTLNGGSTATVSVTVTCVDDAPSATDDSATVAEDASATAIDVFANDVNIDGGPMTIASASDPANGTVVLTGGSPGAHTGLTYQPDPSYCNNGSPLDTFTYTLNGGSTATVSVTVTCAGDVPPTANDDSATVAEDAVATAIDVLANDSNADGGPMNIASASDPANGTVVLTGGSPGAHAGLTYEPDPNFCNAPPGTTTDDFTYTLNGGSTATVSLTVTCVDDAPTVVTSVGMTPWTEGTAPVVIDPAIAVSDVDSGDLTGATIDISVGFEVGDEFNFVNTASITGIFVSATGVLTLSGTASVADYQAALRSIVFATSDDDPGDRTIRFVVTDGTSGSSAATKVIDITGANDAPTAVDDTGTGFSTNEDTSFTTGSVLANDTDPDNDTLTVQAIDTTGTTGLVTNNNDGTFGYDPNGQFEALNDGDSATDTFTYTVSDGNGGTDVATVTITINGVTDGGNVAPTVTTSVGLTPYTEGGGPVVVDATVATSDVDDTNLEGATIDISVGLQAGDVLGFVNTATISGVFGSGVLTLSGSATVAEYQAALRTITFQATTDAPVDKTIRFVVTDGTASSSPSTKEIDVTAVNDAPVVTTTPGTTAWTEGAAAVVVDSAVTVTDVDGNIAGATIDVSSGFQTGDTLAFVDTGSITGSFVSGTGVLTLSGTASAAAYTSALRSITFASTNQAPSDKTVRFVVSDGTASSNAATRDIDVTGVNDAPDAVDDAPTTDEDTQIVIAVLANDTDPDLDALTVTQTGLLSNGGSVLIVNSGTEIQFTPGASFQDLEPGQTRQTAFTYTISDGNGGTDTATVTVTVNGVNDAPTDTGESLTATGNTPVEVEVPQIVAFNGPKRVEVTGNLLDNAVDIDDLESVLLVDTNTVSDPPHGTVSISPEGWYTYTPDAGYTGADSFTYQVKDDSGALSSAQTVSITVTSRVWYVKNNAVAGGDGRSATPFDTIAEADAVNTAAGDVIYVYRGDGTTSGLTTTQVTFGALNQRLIGEMKALVVDGITLYAAQAGQRPNIAAGVSMSGGGVVTGVQLAANAVAGILAGGGNTNGTIDDVIVSGNFGGIQLSGVLGAWTLTDVTVSSSLLDAVQISGNATVAFTATSLISITATGGRGVVLTGATTTLAGQIDSITASTAATTGIFIDDTLGSLTIDDVNLTTTGTAIDIDSANDITITAAGDGTVSSSGPAIDVTTDGANPANGVDITLNSATSSGGAFGIRLLDIGDGNVYAENGTLSGHTTASVDVQFGSGNVQYLGVIGNGTGQSVNVANRSGGMVVIGGSVTDTNDAGGGINLDNNDNSTIAFGGNLTLNTGASAAFVAINGGTVTAQGSASTITTTTGAGVNISGTNIGAAHVTFDTVNVDGSDAAPTNGVLVSGTGSAGSFSITGTGSAGTGGTIQDASGDGIRLVGTLSPSINLMTVTSNLGSGIQVGGPNVADVVTNATLQNLVVSANGNDSGAEDGIKAQNLVGTAGFSGLNVSGSARHNVSVTNNTGTLTSLAIGGSSIHDNGAAASNGLSIIGDGTAVMTVSVGTTNFASNRVSAILVQTNASSTVSATITGGTYTNNFNSVDFTHASSGDLNGTFTGATITNAINGCSGTASPCGTPINVFLGNLASSNAASVLTATITGNTVNNGGSDSAPGIWVHTGTPVRGHIAANISNNTITNVANIGIAVGGGGCASAGQICDATIATTIENNNVTIASASGLEAIHVTGATNVLDTIEFCVDIENNTASSAAADAIRVRHRQSSTIRMPGYAGGQFVTASVVAYLDARNAAVTDTITATTSSLGGGFLNTNPAGSACAGAPA